MFQIDSRLKNFLHEFLLTDEQLREVYSRFASHIRMGLGKNTNANADTKCFITYVQDLPTGAEKGKFLALDLGGSNFRVLLVTLEGNSEASLDSDVYVLSDKVITGPGTELFDHIAECLDQFIQSRKLQNENLPLGFTFSFPCTQQGLAKATLARWTKGFNATGVVNADVVRMLREAIDRRGTLKIDVMAILNDTTGTLMSCAHRNPECRIGLIVGTGCNACYVERVENIELLEEQYKNKPRMIINIEWGAFGERGALDFIRTEYDIAVDKDSINKGNQLFEKMIAGMYMGELVRLILIRAIRENLIFTPCAVKKRLSDVLSKKKYCFETSYLSDIDKDKAPDYVNTKKVLKALFNLEEPCLEDCAKLKFMCDSVARRSGILIGAALAVLINRIKEPKTVVAVDGSVYRYHQRFDEYMREGINLLKEENLKFDVMLSEDGSGRGAALVAAVAANKK